MSDGERLRELKLKSARRGKSRANSAVTARISGVRPIQGGGTGKRRRRPLLELVGPAHDVAQEENADSLAPTIPNDVARFFQNYTDGVVRALLSVDIEELSSLIRELASARADGRTVFVFGNGGSATNSLHLVNDLARCNSALQANLLRILSLNENVTALTSTTADGSHHSIYVNQLEPLFRAGDVVIGISADGESPNIARALRYARENGGIAIAVVGSDGGSLIREANRRLHIPTPVDCTTFAEDVMTILGHMVSRFLAETLR